MSVARARFVGTAGSVLLTGSGFANGALPIDPPSWFGDWREYTLPAMLFGYFGLGLMLAAWWWMRDRADLVTFAMWCVPLALAPPMFSRDVYSYLAQGAMASASLDVYTNGVSRLGGRLAAQVAPMWQDTPAPYGPVFVAICALIAGVAGTKLTIGVVAMRLTALAGVALLAIFVPKLAARCGIEPRAALWLGVLNPLVPLHLVAGAHNDALMLGLLVTGMYLALGQSPRHRFILATVLVTLAALIKAPAVAGLLVIAAQWRSVWKVGAVAALVTVSVTALSGTGYGWISALGTPIHKHSWSLSSALGRLTRPVLGDASMPFWLSVGMGACMVVILVVLWRHQQLGVVYALGLGLLAFALLGPVTRPWYALWGVIPIAAAATSPRLRQACAFLSLGLALLVLPSGFGPNEPLEVALAAAGVGLAALVLLPMSLVAQDRRLENVT